MPSYPVGQAPWETNPQPSGSFPVGQAPWEVAPETDAPVIPEKAKALDVVSQFNSWNPWGNGQNPQGTAIAEISGIGKALTDKLHSLPIGDPERKVILKQLQAMDDAAANAADYQLKSIPSNTEALKQQAGNAAGSLYNIVKGAVKGIVNIANPTMEGNTLVNLGKVGVGAVEKLIPGEQGQEKYVDALGQNYKDKYYDTSVGDPNATGLGKVGRFVQRLGAGTERAAFEDPARVASDVSLSFGLIGGASKLVASGADKLGYGTLAEAATKESPAIAGTGFAGAAQRFGAGATQFAKDINPIVQTVKAGVAVTKLAYSAGKFLATRLAGGLTSRGSAAAERIVENPGEVNQGLSGNVSAKQIAQDAQDLRDSVDASRAEDYQKARDAIGLDSTKAPPEVIGGLKETAQGLMDRYKISVDVDGTYDFSKSPLRADPGALKVVQTALEEVNKLGKGATWGDVDTLKQIMSGLYKGGERSNAITEPLRQASRIALKAVDGYDEMVGKYEDMTDTLVNLKESASLGDKTNMSIAANKLLIMMRDNQQFRQQILEDLVSQSGAKGQQLLNDIAGTSYKDALGSSGLGKIGVGGGVLAVANGVANPAVWAAVLSTSPQILGRLLQLYGFTAEAAEMVANAVAQSGVEFPAAVVGTAGNQANEAAPRFKSNQ